MFIESFNPATGLSLARLPAHTPAEIDARLAQAAKAQRAWAQTSVEQRAAHLAKVAAVLRANLEHYAKLISLEVGKPIAESRAEVEKCAWNFDFYSQHAASMLEDKIVSSSASDSRIVYDPLGLVLAVMPWNYPFWQVMRAVAPVLVGGNGLVLKHASNVPQCAVALEEVFVKAGLPDGLMCTVLTDSKAVAGLIADARIHAVTFTGSTPVGRTIASQAGHALKKQVLELGGSDPFIVLADADIALAAATAAKARFHNTGQSCISAKRFIVEERVAQDFSDAMCAAVQKMKIGDPLDAQTQIGSMARRNLRHELDVQVQASIREGAQLRLGGKAIEGEGAFYEPTVFDHVTLDMTVAREETFGPAAAIIRVASADEAVSVANATDFGLGASLWTGDLDRARALTRKIEAGAVFVNGMVASDPRLPFGGIKQSGYGRELGSLGLHEFCNIKTVWTGPART
jgi:succinate-semialdehyde dehydrogenase / glutarate-semialdehyde dehydrogenase